VAEEVQLIESSLEKFHFALLRVEDGVCGEPAKGRRRTTMRDGGDVQPWTSLFSVPRMTPRIPHRTAGYTHVFTQREARYASD
jgi:hypothetical protein